MDMKQRRKFWRLLFIDNTRIALPFVLAGLGLLALLGYIAYLASEPVKHSTCRYQDFLNYQSKIYPGAMVVICKLDDGKIISFSKPASWIPPEIGSKMDVLVPK